MKRRKIFSVNRSMKISYITLIAMSLKNNYRYCSHSSALTRSIRVYSANSSHSWVTAVMLSLTSNQAFYKLQSHTVSHWFVHASHFNRSAYFWNENPSALMVRDRLECRELPGVHLSRPKTLWRRVGSFSSHRQPLTQMIIRERVWIGLWLCLCMRKIRKYGFHQR